MNKNYYKLVESLSKRKDTKYESCLKIQGNKCFSDLTENEIKSAKKEARKIYLSNIINKTIQNNYISELEGMLVEKKINNEKGTLELSTISKTESLSDIELAKEHSVDLTKYKITNYWTKKLPNGTFTSSLFCKLRDEKTDVFLQEEKVVQIFKNLSKTKPFYIKETKSNSKCALLIVSDEHVAAEVLDTDLYDNKYDASIYYKRKLKTVNSLIELKKLHGKFDKLIVFNLGDALDGMNSQTTRGGHSLAQNMNNKEALNTYSIVNMWIWDYIIENNIANTIEYQCVENSNHGGLGWDYAGNLIVKTYLNQKYPDVNIIQNEKFIAHSTYGIHNIMICHGKDEAHMKRNMPINLNDKTELFIKQYMEDNDILHNTSNIFLKGDLHMFNHNVGKTFHYINNPSLFGASGWIMANFGKTKPGFSVGVLEKNNKSFEINPVFI